MEEINFFDVGKNFESNISESDIQTSEVTENEQGDVLISQETTKDINRDHELKVLSTEESINQAIDFLLQTSEGDMAYSVAQSPLEDIAYDEVSDEIAIELSSNLKAYIEEYIDIIVVRDITLEPNYIQRYYKIVIEWELLEDSSVNGDFVKFLSKN